MDWREEKRKREELWAQEMAQSQALPRKLCPGKVFTLHVADGKVLYKVTAVKGDQCEVALVDGGPDHYVDEVLELGGWAAQAVRRAAGAAASQYDGTVQQAPPPGVILKGQAMTDEQIERWRQELEAFRQRAQGRANHYIGSGRRVQTESGRRITCMVVAIEVQVLEIEPGVSARAVYNVTVAKPDGERLLLRDTGPCCGL